MGARVSIPELQEIISVRTGTNLQAFIDDAHLVVDTHLLGQGLSDGQLKAIEKYVAAHFASVQNPRAQSVSLPKASATFEGRGFSGKGLESTDYGRRALLLDPTGILASLGSDKPGKADVLFLSSPWDD